jgi:hypothetical protein
VSNTTLHKSYFANSLRFFLSLIDSSLGISLNFDLRVLEALQDIDKILHPSVRVSKEDQDYRKCEKSQCTVAAEI